MQTLFHTIRLPSGLTYELVLGFEGEQTLMAKCFKAKDAVPPQRVPNLLQGGFPNEQMVYMVLELIRELEAQHNQAKQDLASLYQQRGLLTGEHSLAARQMMDRFESLMEYSYQRTAVDGMRYARLGEERMLEALPADESPAAGKWSAVLWPEDERDPLLWKLSIKTPDGTELLTCLTAGVDARLRQRLKDYELSLTESASGGVEP